MIVDLLRFQGAQMRILRVSKGFWGRMETVDSRRSQERYAVEVCKAVIEEVIGDRERVRE